MTLKNTLVVAVVVVVIVTVVVVVVDVVVIVFGIVVVVVVVCLFVCFSWNCIRNNIYGIHSQTSTSSFVSALVGSKQLWKRLEFSCSRRQH